MATVHITGGDFDSAVNAFKRKTAAEGILGEYKKSLEFTAPAQERRKRAYIAKQRQAYREERKRVRQRNAIRKYNSHREAIM